MFFWFKLLKRTQNCALQRYINFLCIKKWGLQLYPKMKGFIRDVFVSAMHCLLQMLNGFALRDFRCISHRYPVCFVGLLISRWPISVAHLIFVFTADAAFLIHFSISGEICVYHLPPLFFFLKQSLCCFLEFKKFSFSLLFRLCKNILIASLDQFMLVYVLRNCAP